MQINQLSANGYKISNVFDEPMLAEITQLVDTFTPTDIRPTLDRPELPLPDPNSRREVLLLGIDHLKLKSKLDGYFFQIIPEVSGEIAIELWRDYPGYTNNLHYDADIVHHIMIVYLDGNGEENMGTVYYENNEKYLVTYEKNNGLILLNTSKVYHGMGGSVPDDVKYRKLFYINWMNYA